jgi:hypothetical protein
MMGEVSREGLQGKKTYLEDDAERAISYDPAAGVGDFALLARLSIGCYDADDAVGVVDGWGWLGGEAKAGTDQLGTGDGGLAGDSQEMRTPFMGPCEAIT